MNERKRRKNNPKIESESENVAKKCNRERARKMGKCENVAFWEKEKKISKEGGGGFNVFLLWLKGGFGIFTAMLLGLGETASQLHNKTIVNIQRKFDLFLLLLHHHLLVRVGLVCIRE